MNDAKKSAAPDFKGLRHSKIGYFKEVRSKIKELEKLNLQLAKRHNRLEAIFNSMSDGVTILDKDLNIVFANLVQKRWFPDISEPGMKCHQLFYQRAEQCPRCPVLETLSTGERLSGDHLFKKGRLMGRCFEWTTSPIADAYGKLAETILIMRDITRRKEYEFKLMQSDRMVSVGFLASSLAHEINNPLTSIAGFSEGLLKRMRATPCVLDDKAIASMKEYLQIINSEAYRCKDIIQNLREFSSGQSDVVEPVDIDHIIAATISLIRQHAKDNRIRINYSNHLSAGFNRIAGRSGQLKHLFLNLFKLSFNALAAGGAIDIVARNDGDRIDISLSDPTGTLFEELSGCTAYPLINGAEVNGQSHVDLSICYHILSQHQGTLNRLATSDGSPLLVLRFPVALT
ncbi:MAG: histidine kinase dimerization/phospho-acceptor domain-containing protein [Desulfosarcinaceae bacterium]|nr:histidine kinase dimerization/phospho-acceptor domain-containing protein [Desulfosarcinaceae bacterium]